MSSHEAGHLPTHLECRYVAVQIDPVQTLDVQHEVTLKWAPSESRYPSDQRDSTRSPSATTGSAVRGEASLDRSAAISEIGCNLTCSGEPRMPMSCQAYPFASCRQAIRVGGQVNQERGAEFSVICN